jgi:hypothetical protein
MLETQTRQGADMYAILSRVPAPIEAYDALHAAVKRRSEGQATDGLLVHIGRPIDDGFEVIEVWESREQYERFTRDVVGPALAEVMPGTPPPAPGQGYDEIDVRGLVLPAAALYV